VQLSGGGGLRSVGEAKKEVERRNCRLILEKSLGNHAADSQACQSEKRKRGGVFRDNNNIAIERTDQPGQKSR